MTLRLTVHLSRCLQLTAARREAGELSGDNESIDEEYDLGTSG